MNQILVVDDHEIVRKGIINFLLDRFSNLRFTEAGTAKKAIELLNQVFFDLIVLDLNLPDLNAEKLVKEVRIHSPKSSVIVFSMFSEEVMGFPMQKLGVRHYINKGSPLSKLGDVVFQELNKSKSIDSINQEDFISANPFSALSPQELAILFGIIEGKTNKAIAASLNLSASTVATYKQRIFEKTQVSNTADLVKLAAQFSI